LALHRGPGDAHSLEKRPSQSVHERSDGRAFPGHLADPEGNELSHRCRDRDGPDLRRCPGSIGLRVDPAFKAGSVRGMEMQLQAASEMSWYVIHTYSGYENKAKLALEERIKAAKKEPFFGEIIVPEENVVELVKGQKKTTKRRFFPGYILVKMVLND